MNGIKPVITLDGPTFEDDAIVKFHWSPVFNATDGYRVWITQRGLNGGTLASPYIPNLFLNGTSYETAQLPDGIYQIEVRGLNPLVEPTDVPNPWSEIVTVTVDSSRTTVTQPAAINFDTTPQFAWNAVPGGQLYDLWVNRIDPNTNVTYERQVVRTQITGNTFSPSTALIPGHYIAWVRVLKSGVWGKFSLANRFEVNPNAVVILTTPPGSMSTDLFRVSWLTVPGANSYDVEIVNSTTNAVAKSVNVTSTFYTTNTLAPATYYVRVRAVQNEAKTAFTQVTLNVTDSVVPVISNVTQPTNSTVRVVWNEVPDADSYRFYIARTSSTSTPVVDVILPPSGTGTMSYDVNKALLGGLGDYKVWVRSIQGTYQLPWSVGNVFTFSFAPAILNFGEDAADIVIQWADTSAAQQHRLYIQTVGSPAVVIVNQFGIAPSGTDVLTHRVAKSKFAPGQYKVWARTMIAGVWTDWLAPTILTVTSNDVEMQQPESPELPATEPADEQDVVAVASFSIDSIAQFGDASATFDVDLAATERELRIDETAAIETTGLPADEQTSPVDPSVDGDLDDVMSDWASRDEWWQHEVELKAEEAVASLESVDDAVVVTDPSAAGALVAPLLVERASRWLSRLGKRRTKKRDDDRG